jgi:hypothetical protein
MSVRTRPPREDPARFAVRDVSAHGGIRWTEPWINVSHPGSGADVGLAAIDDGVGKVSCGPRTRGRFLARHKRIEDAAGRLTRRRGL